MIETAILPTFKKQIVNKIIKKLLKQTSMYAQ